MLRERRVVCHRLTRLTKTLVHLVLGISGIECHCRLCVCEALRLIGEAAIHVITNTLVGIIYIIKPHVHVGKSVIHIGIDCVCSILHARNARLVSGSQFVQGRLVSIKGIVLRVSCGVLSSKLAVHAFL